jgi:uncharacterized protein
LGNHIIVFCKNPELGKVKTRVAKTSGDEKALEIYNQLLDITRDVVSQVNSAIVHIYYHDHIDQSDQWPRSYSKYKQVTGDLGMRMKSAFADIFALDAYAKVAIIGSDCPYLTSDIFDQAFCDLENNDLVLGPSTDGGYYLLGMRIFFPDAFDDIDWSTEKVLSQTKHRINAANHSFGTLASLEDVDTYDQWLAFEAFKRTNDKESVSL